MKSTPLCRVGVGEDESGPNLISKAREGAPRGQTRWEVGTRMGTSRQVSGMRRGSVRSWRGQGRYLGQGPESPESGR